MLKILVIRDLGDEYVHQIKELVFGQYNSDKELISSLTNSKDHDNDIYVSITKNALGISMPVVHVVGDYAEFEIGFSVLREK